jgi:hypothetical protein
MYSQQHIRLYTLDFYHSYFKAISACIGTARIYRDLLLTVCDGWFQVRDASYGSSSESDCEAEGSSGEPWGVARLLYAGLGILAVGLVVYFVGTGDKVYTLWNRNKAFIRMRRVVGIFLVGDVTSRGFCARHRIHSCLLQSRTLIFRHSKQCKSKQSFLDSWLMIRFFLFSYPYPTKWGRFNMFFNMLW